MRYSQTVVVVAAELGNLEVQGRDNKEQSKSYMQLSAWSGATRLITCNKSWYDGKTTDDGGVSQLLYCFSKHNLMSERVRPCASLPTHVVPCGWDCWRCFSAIGERRANGERCWSRTAEAYRLSLSRVELQLGSDDSAGGAVRTTCRWLNLQSA